MPTNLEWKARATDFRRQQALAEALAGSVAVLIEQTDTFFPTSSGRLKLRRLSDNRGQLIHYHREDSAAARRSDYRIAETSQPEILAKVLADGLGTIATVRKKRWLYLVGQSRVHFDEVDGLGQFIEVEVVLRENQSVEEATAIARNLKEKLEVADDDLVAVAYADLMSQ